ncbi:MAG: hypothetical protein WC875_01155 [Candidatus Absconditabacterales bacterium]
MTHDARSKKRKDLIVLDCDMVWDKRTLSLFGIMALSFWLGFLFVDGIFSSSVIPTVPAPTQQVQEVVPETRLPDGQAGDMIADQIQTNTPASSGEVNAQHSSAFEVISFSGQEEATNSVIKQASLNDITLLESLYEKNPDSQILVTLIQRLVDDYQFADANVYLQKLMQIPNYQKLLDPHTILYILIHGSAISYKNPNSINELLPLIAQFRQDGLLSKDDENFYNGLIAIRFKKYADASLLFSSNTTEIYTPLIQAYQKALSDFSGSKLMPAYYQDALVALSMLKNGYFSIAKNLALSALMKDDQYILPYQILAYANFLSNNFDVSAEYFLKLADFDAANKDNYLFLVGVSQYRIGDYDQSVLYLNQVTNPLLLTDMYRYELLSYLAGNDMDNALRIRQKLLGQSSLQPSDFMTFFDAFYYVPYSNGNPFTLSKENAPLASMYLDSCARLFSGGADICTYGQIGQQLTNLNWTGIAQPLLYLSSTYHQQYLFHILGDYYFQNMEYDLAKDAYSQALTLATRSDEQIILKDKLQKTINE